MAPSVKKLKNKTVDGDRYSLRSYPSPSKGRYYAVKKNGQVIEETSDRQRAQRVYSRASERGGQQGSGLFDTYSFM